MIGRYILAWIPMIPIAIINAAIRETVFRKLLDELRSHQLSTITGILLFGLYVWLLVHIWPLTSASQALIIGCIWLLLTIAFEFLAGHYLFGQPWSRLLGDYNLTAGRIWPLVLIWIAIAPFLFYRSVS